MGWWFQKHKTSPLPRQSQQSQQPQQPQQPLPVPNPSVQQLEMRVQKLEEHLASLAAKRPEIRIDTLHIHQPVLENLSFRLDQLDIKELSGSLNLGNNFGAKPSSKSPQLDEALKKASESSIEKPPSPARSPKADAADTSAGLQERRPPGRESSSDAPFANTERTSTGYRYTPQTKPTGGA
jgi:hypothetical protein